MAAKFGTSGLRGLVAELSDDVCASYTQAFLKVIGHGGTVMIGRDLRPSSPRISAAVADAALAMGCRVLDCGEVPTPALALAAMTAGAPSIMVTGSHIPADRNGLKFFGRMGEITKTDEAAILAKLSKADPAVRACAKDVPAARADYARRYILAYDGALQGLRIGLYQHSSVARDLLAEVLETLGATVTPLGRSDTFVPVDTEAVSDATQKMLADWAAEGGFDAIVSTDGDADRPLLTDAAGRLVPGDVIGTLTALSLGTRSVVTPISSNTLIETSGHFRDTLRTRIGSPYVIAGMATLMAEPEARVAGFEANGGFLLGFEAAGPTGPIAPLLTRDAFLPIIATLGLAKAQGLSIAGLTATLPARATASDRLSEVPTGWSQGLLADLSASQAARAKVFARSHESHVDHTDGLRITFADGAILHLRPSGNAPELRCYAEADTAELAAALVRETLARIRGMKSMGEAPAQEAPE